MKLSVLKRNQPIQKIDLGKDVLAFDYSETVFLIGRSKDCHIVLDDKQAGASEGGLDGFQEQIIVKGLAEDGACAHFAGGGVDRVGGFAGEVDDGRIAQGGGEA